MKKILFNDNFLLTKAVLDGRKTQTRRIINPQPTYQDNCGICWKGYAYGLNLGIDGLKGCYRIFVSGTEYDKSCRRYRKGEVVSVAQSYETSWQENASAYHNPYFLRGLPGWKNKMFVKSTLMPHLIRITDVRVERLQDISEEDAIAEGITYAGLFYEDYGDPMFIIEGCKQTFGSARDAYAWLIDKISGKGTWQSNPYVFVYNFELIK